MRQLPTLPKRESGIDKHRWLVLLGATLSIGVAGYSDESDQGVSTETDEDPPEATVATAVNTVVVYDKTMSTRRD
jgi:hypothetical protein